MGDPLAGAVVRSVDVAKEHVHRVVEDAPHLRRVVRLVVHPLKIALFMT